MLLHDGGPRELVEASVLAVSLEKRLVAHLAFPLGVTAVSLRAGPTLTDALAGAGDVVLAVPLEPLWSEVIIERYRAALAAAGRGAVPVVGGWQDDERFRRAVVERCRGVLDGRFDETAVLYLAEPLPDVGGPEYHDAAQLAAARLVGMMAPGDWRLAFWEPSDSAGQSGERPADPQAPPGLEALLEWEWPTVLVVGIGRLFPRETDVALDECLGFAVAQAGRAYRRAPAIGTDPTLLALLSDAVVEHLARRPLTGGDRVR